MSGGGAGGGFTTLCPWMVYTGPLPIELQNFYAWSEENKVYVSWSTASESNCMLYDIERSADGVEFEAIGQLAANGTTSTAHHYNFTDANPLSGTAYYRLRSVDFDLNAQYSHIISCTTNAEPAIIMYYNLTGQSVQLENAVPGIYIQEIISGGQSVRKLYYHSR
jgi:hypothetical protein